MHTASDRSTDEPGLSALAGDFAEISRALYAAHTIEETLQRIVTFSVAAIDNCAGAGISFVQGDQIVTPVWTEPKVLEIDSMQYSTGEGPCLDAIASGSTRYASDLLTDPRWPTFGPRAAAAGMRSLLSFCLFGETTLGALNLYAPNAAAFDDADQVKGTIFASHAGVALAAAGELDNVTQALATEVEKLANLQGALASRQVIGRAEGILMERQRITAEQAFDLLREASQHLNTKLRDVARHVVETGEVPGSPS